MNKFFIFLILSMSLLSEPVFAAPGSTPYTMNFSGFLVESGVPANGTFPMKFSIGLNGVTVPPFAWCAEYTSVVVTNGDFSVVLGGTAQGGEGLDTATCTTSTPANLPINPAILSSVDSSVPVQVVAAASTDGGVSFETFSPSFSISSSLFALQADSALTAEYAEGLQGVAVSTTAPTPNQVLSYVGGQWTPSNSAVSSPGAPLNSIQFNNAGSFGGNADLTWDNVNFRFGIGPIAPLTQIDVSGQNANGTLRVYDQTAATGNTREIIRAGAAQTANLLEFQNNTGSVLLSVGSGGLVYLPVAPSSSTSASLDLGAAIAGGNAAGTYIGMNTAGGYTGDLMDLQVNSTKEFVVGSGGTVTATAFIGNGAGLTNLPAGAIPWTTPGTIGSVTPNTGAFTTLSANSGSTISGTTLSGAGNIGTSGTISGAALSISGGSTLTGATSMTGGLAASSGTISGTTLSGAGNINTAGTITGSDFVGSGAGLTGISVSSLQNYSAGANGTTITGGAGTLLLGGSTITGAGNISTAGSITGTAMNILGSSTITGATSITGGVAAASGTISGTTLSGAGNINTAGTITGSDFIGSGGGLTNIPNSAVNWASPGTIGSTTPTTGAFTALTSKGTTSDNTTTSFNAMNSTGTSLLFVRDDGNIGIGTTTPKSNLDVRGGISVGSYAGTIAAPPNSVIVSGQTLIGASSDFLDPDGPHQLLVTGANGTNIAAFTNTANTAQGGFYIGTGNPYAPVQMGSITNSSFGIFTNDGFPQATLNPNGGMAIGLGYNQNVPPANGAIIQGNVGIGTTTPAGTLDVEGGFALANTNGTNLTLNAQSASSGNQNGGNIILMPGAPTGNGAPAYVGIGTTSPAAKMDVNISTLVPLPTLYGTRNTVGNNSNGTISTAAGNYNSVSNDSTGTISNAYGSTNGIFQFGAGNITNAYGAMSSISNESSGIINFGYDFYAGAPSNTGGGTLQNFYGLFIANPTAASTNYSIYSTGGTNYFAGNIGIGTSVPGAALEVDGTTKLGTSGVAITSMGACSIASFTAATTNTKACTNLPTGSAVSCSPTVAQSTCTWSSFASSAGNVSIVLSGCVGGAASPWYCMWVQP